jgi:hypothetical protein
MLKLLAGLCCLLVVVLVIISVVVSRIDNRMFRRWTSRQPVQVVCIRCQGRGWTQETVRSLEFDGQGFVDSDTPAKPCPACHGTGTVTR